MSAKWRALQHRHRYTYTSLIFPPSFLQTLQNSPSHIDFFTQLNNLISLTSIYSQITAVKNVASAFADLLSSNTHEATSIIPPASKLYLELLFLENSLPLHRTLISVLERTRSFRDSIGTSFESLCEEYGPFGTKRRRFAVCRAALSILSYPKLGFLSGHVENCAVLISLDVAFGLRDLVSDTGNGFRPSPAVMEQCQEALSCSYYLLQKFPAKFSNSSWQGDRLGCGELSGLEIVVREILSVLNSSAFSRDCLVAAGVSFCAAIQVRLSPPQLATFLVEALFSKPGNAYTIRQEREMQSLNSSKMDLKKEDLCSEIRGFSVLSRLCLLRGVLTAVQREVLNTQFLESSVGLNDVASNNIWTILFNGILSELCDFCENPIDSHFNFHALTVTQICLQQIKASLLAGLTDFSGNYDPFTEEMGTRLLRIIWNNLEDPLNQTVKQVHLIFDLFLDIHSTIQLIEGGEGIKSFHRKIASDLLRLGARCKGRYAPLASLAKRMGARSILDMNPKLLFETMHAYVDDDVCCAVTSFLKCFLENLRDECWSSEGIEIGYAVFREFCLPPLMDGLVSGLSKLRSNLNTYALPVFLEVDVESIFTMLAFISVRQFREGCEIIHPELFGLNFNLTIDQRVAALVSLLKVSRLLALIEGDIDWSCVPSVVQEETSVCNGDSNGHAVVFIKGIHISILVEWLVLALTHVDDSLRIDAAETLFINPKTSSLPSALELSLLKEAVPLNMRCCSTAFQMKWASLFRKFFSRVRTALERQVKQGSWQPVACSSNSKDVIDSGACNVDVEKAEVLFRFMKWLSCFLFFSCYPSAPYERKTLAMELILIMINVWPIVSSSHSSSMLISPASCIYPYHEAITSPHMTLLLVGSIIDSWDRLRESSFRILMHFPTPLSGISGSHEVKQLIAWAKRLVCSPRVRESDAGALTLRLIFRKYVVELGWIINVSVATACFLPCPEESGGASEMQKLGFPLIEYIQSLVEWLCAAVEEGEKDLSEACERSFVHGILLTLRYTFEELDWNSDVVSSNNSGIRNALEKLLDLIMRITSLALWVVSADAWYLPEEMDDIIEDGSFLSDVPFEMKPSDFSSELPANDSKVAEMGSMSDQVVMVGCWLAMKEVSLLLGTIIRKIPLPSCTTGSCEPAVPPYDAVDIQPATISDAVLDLKQLETIGNHFLEVLLKMKHNGAIDKTRAGFTALCNRLLCSNDSRLCTMTESWMEQLMERTVAKGQTVDDLLRRSAGIPAAFLAFFLSEPEGTPKKLLPRALRWLIDVAKSFPGRSEVQNLSGDFLRKSSKKPIQDPACALAPETDLNERTSKIRDEGVIPTVHAFNVLRAAFNDTNLAADTSGFSAEALTVSILSFSSPYWEVRNSACLAFTALVRRMVGFLNVHKRQSARRALTGLEFFHRFPTLHLFLLKELKIATEALGAECLQDLNMVKALHPSLCPVLILLSRLKPSMISEMEDMLDPFAFMPFIRRCATQSNIRVRVLASRALTGLVSNEKLEIVVNTIAFDLPHVRNNMAFQPATGSDNINGVENKNMCGASFNFIHGLLLQLIALVDTNCRNLIDGSKKERILDALMQVLVKCSWLGSARTCHCPSVNSSYLQLLDLMLGISGTCGISRHVLVIRSLLLKLSSKCLGTHLSSKILFCDPTLVQLRKQAAATFFNCIFSGSPELMLQRRSPSMECMSSMPETEMSIARFKERLTLCISDDSYEVRHATLKWLHQVLKLTESGGVDIDSVDVINMWASTCLQPCMLRLLSVEEYPKCIYYILQILFTWNKLQFTRLSHMQGQETEYIGTMNCDSLFCLWKKLISLKESTKHLKSRETLLRFMGSCVKQFANIYMHLVLYNCPAEGGGSSINSSAIDGLERWADIFKCIDSFVILIKQNSAPSEPVSLRKAAAESMIASGLLEQAALVSTLVINKQIPTDKPQICKDENKEPHFHPSKVVDLYACRILDMWFTCIKLLEDEDVGLRERLSVDVQRCLHSTGTDESVTHAVPIQVEKVIQLCFDSLSSIFGHWIKYLDYLARWAFEMAGSVVVSADLVRRVFDKEIDNHHEERLLICQTCCLHLEKLSNSWAVESSKLGLHDCNVRAFLHKWRMRYLHQLISFANDYIGSDGADWIGGIGNHKDAFVWLYGNLLGLYALSKCHLDSSYLAESGIQNSLVSKIVELNEVIRPFLRNPLVSNLYLLVIESYESMMGVTLAPKDSKSRGDSSLWENFDAYFLR